MRALRRGARPSCCAAAAQGRTSSPKAARTRSAPGATSAASRSWRSELGDRAARRWSTPPARAAPAPASSSASSCSGCRGAPSASTCATTSAYFVEAIGEIVEAGDRAAGSSPSTFDRSEIEIRRRLRRRRLRQVAPRGAGDASATSRAPRGSSSIPVYTGKAFHGMAQELERDKNAFGARIVLHPHRRHLRPVPQGEGARRRFCDRGCAARRARRVGRVVGAVGVRLDALRAGVARGRLGAREPDARDDGAAGLRRRRAGDDARPRARRHRPHARAAGSGSSVLCAYGFADNVFFASARRVGITTALAIASSYPLWAALVGVVWRRRALRPRRARSARCCASAASSRSSCCRRARSRSTSIRIDAARRARRHPAGAADVGLVGRQHRQRQDGRHRHRRVAGQLIRFVIALADPRARPRR